MSVLENMKSKVKEFTDPDGPGADMLNSAKSALSHGIDGASKFVDEKTNGKYSDHINTGVGKAKEFLADKKPDDGSPQGSSGDSAQPKGSTGSGPDGDGGSSSSEQPPQS